MLEEQHQILRTGLKKIQALKKLYGGHHHEQFKTN